MEHRIIYITTSNKEEALKIGKDLLEKRYIACLNIIDGMESMYWWEGKIESSKEAILILKTTVDFVEKIISQVKKIHSYSCPCILSLQIDNGNPEYLNWILQETKPS